MKTKYPWLLSPLEFSAFYSNILCVTTLEYRVIGGGLENFFKSNIQKGVEIQGGRGSEIDTICISVSYFHTFLQALRKTLKKKNIDNAFNLINLRRPTTRTKSLKVITFGYYNHEGI